MSLTTSNQPAGADGGRIQARVEAILRDQIVLRQMGEDSFVEGHEQAAERVIAALASTAGAGAVDPIAEACEPWRFGAGDPPNDDSPLIGVYSAGIGYAIDMLAKITNAGEYVGADGSETFEGDVRGTIMNVLRAAKLYDDEDGRFATLSAAGAAAGDWQPIWTAPKDGTRLLCLTRLRLRPKGGPYRTEFEWNVGHFDDETGAWFSEEGADIDPSHWQPLPALPGQSPAVPASPRSGAGEEAVEAAAATYYDSMMGQVPHTEGWAGKPEEFKTKVRERMALALAAASQASALSQGGGAGRSERAVEIRELHAALSKGHALLCESGPDRCWVKIGFGWLQDAQDAHGALARFIKAAAPAQSPSTSDREG